MNNSFLRYNHLGYAPFSPKVFLSTYPSAFSFQILNERSELVFEGELLEQGLWEPTQELCFKGDFSDLKAPGRYRIVLDSSVQSDWFQIGEAWISDQFDANLKSFYYQRSGVDLLAERAGKWARPAAHLDDAIPFHKSMDRGGLWNAHGGWYDAGDYGKYIVNAGVSLGTLLLIAELYPEVCKHSPLLEEIRFELDWFIRMQDHDGGVFFKVSPDRWDSFVPPHETIYQRRILGKSTTSTLNFAAVLAHAHRVFSKEDADFARKCLEKSKNAYLWAQANPDIAYPNNTEGSGLYGDSVYSDEFFWARAMLFREGVSDFDILKDLLEDSKTQSVLHAITWRDTQNFGWIALALQGMDLELQEKARLQLEQSAKEIVALIEQSPHRISLSEFHWGSNGLIANHALTLAVVHEWSTAFDYAAYAFELIDFIYGRNPQGMSFVTGSCASAPMFPHHRISGSDGIDEPVPGLVVGGINEFRQDSHREVPYPSDLPGFSYSDFQKSFASNETAINWSAPLCFALAYLKHNYTSKKLPSIQVLTWDLSSFSHIEQVKALIDANAQFIQLRQKSGTFEDKLKVAKEAVELCQKNEIRIVINDDPYLAKESLASGVHLGLKDTPVSTARFILGSKAIIGGTANSILDVKRRLEEGVDYIGLGPYKNTSTKENLSPILGAEGVLKVVQMIESRKKDSLFVCPFYVIGGISYEDTQVLQDLGASGIAVSSLVVGADNIQEAYKKLKF